MGWTYTYDVNTPVGTNAPSVIDDRIRETKAAIQERLNVEHIFDLTGSQVSHTDSGKHTEITCTSVTSTGAISGTTITASGAISGTTISGSGDLAINTDKFTVTAATGNTTVAGTFTSTGVATLADASLLKTSAAPTTDAMIANKKYVDDQITANASAANSLCKGWAKVASNGTINASYNVASVVRNSAGNYTVSWDTDFSSAHYVVVAIANTSNWVATYYSMLAGSVVIATYREGYGLTDSAFCVVAFGAQ